MLKDSRLVGEIKEFSSSAEVERRRAYPYRAMSGTDSNFMRTHERAEVKEPPATPRSGEGAALSGRCRTQAFAYLRQEPPVWREKTSNVTNSMKLPGMKPSGGPALAGVFPRDIA